MRGGVVITLDARVRFALRYRGEPSVDVRPSTAVSFNLHALVVQDARRHAFEKRRERDVDEGELFSHKVRPSTVRRELCVNLVQNLTVLALRRGVRPRTRDPLHPSRKERSFQSHELRRSRTFGAPRGVR